MFRPLLADRKALLAILGLAICGAYVAGGLAAVGGIEASAAGYAARFPSAGAVAHDGEGLFDSRLGSPPPGIGRARIGQVDAEDGAFVVAAVTHAAPAVPALVGAGSHLERALGRPFEHENATVPSIDVPAAMPGNWVYVPEANFTNFSASEATVWIVPSDALDAVPDGVHLVAGSGLPRFALEGLAEFRDVVWILVAGTAIVVLLLTTNVAYVAVASHARELGLLSALGGSRRRLTFLVTAWMARVVVVGILAGAAFGVVLTAAAFSAAPLFGVRAVVAPRLEVARFGLAMGILAAAAIVGAYFGARGAVRRLLGASAPTGVRGATVAIVLCLAIFATAHSVLASVLAPPDLYAEGAAVIVDSPGPIPTRSAIPLGFASELRERDVATAAVPSIFVFTTLDGVPVGVRGAPPGELLSLHRAGLLAGRLPERMHEILLGENLARRTGLAIGDEALLAGAFRPMQQPVEVVGIYRAPDLLADEMVVPLSLARLVSDAPAQHVHAIEAVPKDRAAFDRALDELRRPALIVEVPIAARAGNVSVLVVDRAFEPVSGANVTVGGDASPARAEAATGPDGRASFTLPAGDFPVVATKAGYSTGEATTHLVLPSGPANLVATRLVFASAPRPGREVVVFLEVRNLGAEAGERTFRVEADGVPADRVVRLDAGAARTERFVFRAPVSGEWRIRAEGLTIERDLSLEGADLQWRLAEHSRLGASTPSTSATVEVFVGNVLVTGGAISLLTVLLVSVGVAGVCTRKVWERGEDLALLRSVGATRGQVRGLVLGRVLRHGAPAAAFGLALGVALAWLLLWLRPLRLFGHELPFSFRVEPLVFGALLAGASLAASSLLAAGLWMGAYAEAPPPAGAGAIPIERGLA